MSAPLEVSLRLDARDKLLIGALALVLSPVLFALGKSWWNSDHMSHGFLVPLVSAFVAVDRRSALAAVPAVVDRRGLLALVVALLAALAGPLAGSLTLAGAGVVGCVVAVVWFRRGSAWLSVLTFPLAYLLFMVPPPEEMHSLLVNWLQGWASSASVAGLYALGVPVFLEGYVIEMVGGMRVEVAEACSGATSLYTLTAIGVLLAFMSLARRRTRALLVALVFPVAMVGNLARVVATVLLCIQFGVARATSGTMHNALGLLTYVVAVGLLLAADALLRRYEKRLAP